MDFGVVLQTVVSGISELPFGLFVLFMQPVHLAIGVVEGVVTAALVSFVWKARPEVIELADDSKATGAASLKPILLGFAIATIITGGLLSWFASAHPDGLEWAMFKTSGQEELDTPDRGVHSSLADIQERTAFLPDYGFAEPESETDSGEIGGGATPEEPDEQDDAQWPAVSAGTSLSGLVGGGMVLLIAGLLGVSLRLIKKRRR